MFEINPDHEKFRQVIAYFQWFSAFLFATLRQIRDTNKKIYNQKHREYAQATRRNHLVAFICLS